MDEVTKEILKRIEILKTRPKMVISVSTIDFQILRIYIEGLINGMEEILNVNLMRKITYWYQDKVNQKASVFWTNHIQYRYNDKTDDELKLILLDTLKEFILENPDWLTKQKEV